MLADFFSILLSSAHPNPLTEPPPPVILATVTLIALFTNKERVLCIQREPSWGG
jgi:hypothetical protein